MMDDAGNANIPPDTTTPSTPATASGSPRKRRGPPASVYEWQNSTASTSFGDDTVIHFDGSGAIKTPDQVPQHSSVKDDLGQETPLAFPLWHEYFNDFLGIEQWNLQTYFRGMDAPKSSYVPQYRDMYINAMRCIYDLAREDVTPVEFIDVDGERKYDSNSGYCWMVQINHPFLHELYSNFKTPERFIFPYFHHDNWHGFFVFVRSSYFETIANLLW
jgi:hypothetical protein